MNDLTDRKKLRNLAEIIHGEMPNVWYGIYPTDSIYWIDPIDAEFVSAANPATIIDLLDQLDAAETTLTNVRALADEWEHVGKWDRAAKRAHDKLIVALDGNDQKRRVQQP